MCRMMKARYLAALYRQPWPKSPVLAPRLDPAIPIEEEKTPNYDAGRFSPAHLGQILNGRYQIATKLSYGANSTVWLARDLNRWRWLEDKYVAVKVNASSLASRRVPPKNKVGIMNHISRVNPNHKGRHFVKKLSDSFLINETSGSHVCLVLEALREPLWLYRRRYINNVIPPDILKILVQMILHALDYLHTECHIIHTDLKPDNIMVKIEDPAIFDRDAKDEFDNPLPQKHLLSKGQRTSMFYQKNGDLKDPSRIPANFTLKWSINCMSGEEKTRFIHFVKRMLTWRPEERSTAKELLDDPWLYEDFPQD